MKYRILASVFVLVILLIVAVLIGASKSSVNEDGSNTDSSSQVTQ